MVLTYHLRSLSICGKVSLYTNLGRWNIKTWFYANKETNNIKLIVESDLLDHCNNQWKPLFPHLKLKKIKQNYSQNLKEKDCDGYELKLPMSQLNLQHCNIYASLRGSWHMKKKIYSIVVAKVETDLISFTC